MLPFINQSLITINLTPNSDFLFITKMRENVIYLITYSKSPNLFSRHDKIKQFRNNKFVNFDDWA